jgi:hypothetical protein
MIIRRRTHLVISLLALSITLTATAALRAQDRPDQGAGDTTATLQVTHGSAAHWASISGTRVEEIPQAERPEYDLFRIDGSYYAYSNDRWYTSHQDHGSFTVIDNDAVPGDLSKVPREHWHNYPSGWQIANDNHFRQPASASVSLHVGFKTKPHWVGVSGTRVKELHQGHRPDYDMFQYGSSYYVYNNNRWYMSRQWHGDFPVVEDRSVPSELSRVPRDHWRNFPQEWADQYGSPRSDNHSQRH